MSITNTQIPMPEELKNLKPPTRQDAIDTLRRRFSLGTRHIERFEDSTRGEQCGRGMYGGMDDEKCREYRRIFDEQYEAGIADGMAQTQREYEANLARKAKIEEHNAAVLQLETDLLRQRYLEQPGATEAGFTAALPELLEERRRRQALEGMSQHEKMMDQMRGNVRI